jgi:hypothetical protein
MGDEAGARECVAGDSLRVEYLNRALELLRHEI